MFTEEKKNLESEDTHSIEQTVEPEPEEAKPELVEPSRNGTYQWIKSADLRILPLEVLLTTNNAELTPDSYYPAAGLISGNPLVHIFYGLDEERRIKTALFLTINLVDNCLYVSNYFGADLEYEEIRTMIEEHARLFNVKAIKITRSSILYQEPEAEEISNETLEPAHDESDETPTPTV